MKTRPFVRDLATSLTAVASAALLAACSPDQGDQTAGQRLDRAVASASQKSAEIVDGARAAGNDVARTTSEGVDKAVDKVKDAAITTAINAKLAMADKLIGSNVDVDTVDGQVVLRGTAPDVRAREEAAQLATSIDGVRSVENQIVVAARS
jgi:hyperosmotically inducible periplasmic protein